MIRVDGIGEKPKATAGKRPSANAPQISGLHSMLIDLCQGKDLSILPAHTDYSILQIISEVGTDLSKWPTEKHFTAWLGLAPGTSQSGKHKSNVKRSRSNVGRYFCVMARITGSQQRYGVGRLLPSSGGTTWGVDCQYCFGSEACGIVLASHGQRDGVCRGWTGRL